ncbi:MAG: hypothetical protein IKO32_12605, partial [Lachnospiraceae bacterium]|nr:hypothetical protein [Lachnospiraceae bacterium]
DNVDRYLQKHDNEDKLKDKRAKRMDAMADGRDNLDRLEKKLNEMEKEYLKKPAQTSFELTNGIDAALLNIENTAKKQGQGLGNYKSAQKKFKEFHDTVFQDNNEIEKDFDKMNPDRIAQIERKMDKAEKEIDEFLNRYQKVKNPPEDTKARYEAMKQAKGAIVETRKKFNQQKEKNVEKDNAKSDRDFKRQTNEASDEVTRKENQAFFGSRAFRKARISYEKVHGNMVMRDRKNKNKELSEEDLEKSLKEISEAKKNVAKYISEKRKELAKKGTLDDKGLRRLHSMEKAYNSLDALENRVSTQLDNKKSKRLGDENSAGKEKMKGLQEKLKKTDGAQRTLDRAAVDATKTIHALKDKKKLNPRELEGAKKALIALMLQKHAEKFGESVHSFVGHPKAYAAQIQKLSEQKSFKKAFPDKKLTPEYLNKIANDPKELERARQDYMAQLSKDGKLVFKDGPAKKGENPELDQQKKQEKNPMMK